MPRSRSMAKGFERWPRDNGLGFSLSVGEVRGELQPCLGDDGLVGWYGHLWRNGTTATEVIGEVWGSNHWDAGDDLAALARDLG